MTAPAQAGERYVAISAEIDKLSCRYCRDGVPRAKVLSGAWKHEFEGEWLLRCDSISDKVLAALAQFSVTSGSVTMEAQELADKISTIYTESVPFSEELMPKLIGKVFDAALSKASSEMTLPEVTTEARELARRLREECLGNIVGAGENEIFESEVARLLDAALSKARKEELVELRWRTRKGYDLHPTMASYVDDRIAALESPNPPEGAAEKEKKS